ncbi:MAG TPA: HAS-barrel domain-containing protein [Allocoleopsis sp.]
MFVTLPQFSREIPPDQVGEVIETSTTGFLAQCLEPQEISFPKMPPFGSWVKSIDEESQNQIYAIVYHGTTTPIDTVHRARALGLSIPELKEQQPQIFAMLKTEFKAVIIGFQSADESGTIFQYIPPRPPQIHQSVSECRSIEIINFSEKLDFLRTLLLVGEVPVESLIAAVIRQIYHLRKFDRQWLVKAGRELNLILRDDYDRLRVILSQI